MSAFSADSINYKITLLKQISRVLRQSPARAADALTQSQSLRRMRAMCRAVRGRCASRNANGPMTPKAASSHAAALVRAFTAFRLRLHR